MSMFGMDRDKVTTGFFLTTTHPEDLKRHHLARTKLISVAEELYIQKSGTRIISAKFQGEERRERRNMPIICIKVSSSTARSHTHP